MPLCSAPNDTAKHDVAHFKRTPASDALSKNSDLVAVVIGPVVAYDIRFWVGNIVFFVVFGK